MRWVLLFGGIVLLGGAGYIMLGWWLWRRSKALFTEVREATGRMELALATSSQDELVKSGAGPTAWDTAPAKGVPSKD